MFRNVVCSFQILQNLKNNLGVTQGSGYSFPLFRIGQKGPFLKELHYYPSRKRCNIKLSAMKIYKKESIQYVNATLEDCWTFFSSPRNLQKITPLDMGFQITDFDGKNVYPGQVIQYKVSPLAGIKLSWMTVITAVKEQAYFIDEQRFGPYSLWHHKHFFEATENGTKMTDVVHYALPLGFIGQIMNSLVVKSKLNQIFAFREKAVDALFNSK